MKKLLSALAALLCALALSMPALADIIVDGHYSNGGVRRDIARIMYQNPALLPTLVVAIVVIAAAIILRILFRRRRK